MTTTAVLASAILAIDLGKYKSVACEFHAATGKVKFRTIDTGRGELIESVKPVELVFEASPVASARGVLGANDDRTYGRRSELK